MPLARPHISQKIILPLCALMVLFATLVFTGPPTSMSTPGAPFLTTNRMPEVRIRKEASIDIKSALH
jgi:hypothetical protein